MSHKSAKRKARTQAVERPAQVPLEQPSALSVSLKPPESKPAAEKYMPEKFVLSEIKASLAVAGGIIVLLIILRLVL